MSTGDFKCNCCGRWMVGDERHGVGECAHLSFTPSYTPLCVYCGDPVPLAQVEAHAGGVCRKPDIHAFFRAHGQWSEAIFGTREERGPVGPLKHLAKEVQEELLPDPTRLCEYADCLMLLLDATRRAGYTSEQLLEEAWRKLGINKQRTWSKAGPTDPVEHLGTDGHE